MASIDVQVASCTLSWPHRYGEVWLDWRGSGQFERLVDSVGGTYQPSMTAPFKFRFRVPADAVPGRTRLRVGTYECQHDAARATTPVIPPVNPLNDKQGICRREPPDPGARTSGTDARSKGKTGWAQRTARGSNAQRIYVDDYMTSFYTPWATYIELISAPPQRMEECTHRSVHGTVSRPPGCDSNFAIESSSANSSLADLQAQYAAWRPYYTAKLRAAMGTSKILIANAPAPSVADPALNGITIEFEHCAGDQRPHQDAMDHSTAGVFSLNAVCRRTLLGQKAQTDLAGLQPVFGLWLTHSEVMPAKQQCAELATVQQELAWVRQGDDITDCTRETGPASCVHCNTTDQL